MPPQTSITDWNLNTFWAGAPYGPNTVTMMPGQTVPLSTWRRSSPVQSPTTLMTTWSSSSPGADAIEKGWFSFWETEGIRMEMYLNDWWASEESMMNQSQQRIWWVKHYSLSGSELKQRDTIEFDQNCIARQNLNFANREHEFFVGYKAFVAAVEKNGGQHPPRHWICMHHAHYNQQRSANNVSDCKQVEMGVLESKWQQHNNEDDGSDNAGNSRSWTGEMTAINWSGSIDNVRYNLEPWH